MPKRRRTRRGSLIAPEEPGAQISRDEFQELVHDLDIEEEEGAATDRRPASTKVASRTTIVPSEGEPEQQAAAAPPRDPAADLAPEDLVLKDAPKPRPKRRRPSGTGKRRKHGRAR